MKHLCVVNPNHVHKTVGGAEVQLHILTHEAVKRGWRVTYVTRPSQIPQNKDGIEYVPFQESKRVRRDRHEMDGLLSDVEADVYYQRGRKLWTGYVGYFASKHHAPFIYAVSMDIDCYTYKRATRSGRNDAVSRLKRTVLARRIDRISLDGIRNASLILAQTKTQETLLARNLGLQSTPFANVFPIKKLQDKKDGRRPRILWLATVKHWKRPELFIEAARKMRRVDCEFLLAGRIADSEFRSQLQRAESEIHNFTYIEQVPFERSNELIATADVFVNTSNLEEGFPNTYVQAWLQEVPTVALGFDPDGVIAREGLGANTTSMDELCERLTFLVENAAHRKEIGQRARDYAIRHHGLEQNIGRFFQMLDNASRL